jgi:hypothetical protein
MKKLPLIMLIFGVLAVLFFSCKEPDPDPPEPYGGPFPEDYAPSQKKTFRALNYTNKTYYNVDAVMLASNDLCEVWVEFYTGVHKETAESIAAEYKNNIYSKMISTFSENEVYDEIEDEDYDDIMDFALSYFAQNQTKLSILLLDMKDGYHPSNNPSYLAGVFDPVNMASKTNEPNSNERVMIYLDTNPVAPGSKEMYMTFAHEMQHLMNFAYSWIYRYDEDVQDVLYMDTWIDEGLSAAAEWWLYNEHPEEKWKWYNQNGGYGMKGSIDVGNNFFVWGNRTTELDDYATVYLFFQWLRLQSNKGIYLDIITSASYDYFAVTEAAYIIGNSKYDSGNWSALLGDWLAASYINAASGLYGYRNDSVLKQIKAPSAPSGVTSLNLYPGEGVYSKANTQPTISGQGTNIVNVYLTTTLNTSFQAGSVLLTYNKKTVSGYDATFKTDSGTTEKGVITGVAAASINQGGRFIASLSGSFRIDARDMLRRNGVERNVPNINSRRVVR